jgi:hypothetical protein
MTKKKSLKQIAQRLWDSCRDHHAAEAARKNDIAARVRALAQELGATLGSMPNSGEPEWRIPCLCGVPTFVDEAGLVYTRAPHSKKCLATLGIARLVRDSLA